MTDINNIKPVGPEGLELLLPAAGARIGGAVVGAHRRARNSHLSAAGRTGQLPGQCHRRSHDTGGQRPDPVDAVRHHLGYVVGRGRSRRPHRDPAGAELAR